MTNGDAEDGNRLLAGYPGGYDFPSLVIRSEKMQEVMRSIVKFAPYDTPILLEGETGVGKTELAREIHHLSKRNSGPFETVDCSALPDGTLESELFGHEKGAFTGAFRRKPGLFELAGGGTLFLEEISNVSLHLQAKLLKVLEWKRIRRVGGTKWIDTDFRLVTATNKNLSRFVSEGKFREDLFYRVLGCAIEVPPLRERRDEIIPIAKQFLQDFAKRHNLAPDLAVLSLRARKILETYSWPGNVRQLRYTMECAFCRAEGQIITRDHITLPRAPQAFPDGGDGFLTIRQLEKDHIIRVLEYCEGNKRRASEILGITVKTLFNRMTAYGLHERLTRKLRAL